MSKVFVDTAAWIAILNSRDALHHRAKQIRYELRQQNAFWVTTEFVLLEVADGFCGSSMRMQAADFIDGLRSLPMLQIMPVNQTLLAEAWTLYKQRPDKEWGLTDCTSFMVMRREQITQAFTSDHHFEQAGFVKLL